MNIASVWRKAIVVTLLALMLVLVVPAKEASACSGCGCPSYYRIRYGDSLYSIARRFGVSVWQLASWNGIPNINHIYAGRTLVIYPGCWGGHVYYVHCGDTLWSIAQRYGTTVWAIAHANGIWNVNHIYAGQRLWIP
jgi:LysM repeat protein